MQLPKPILQAGATLLKIRTVAACIIICAAFSIAGCKKSKSNPNPTPDPGSTNIDSAAITKGTAEGSTEAVVNVDDDITTSTFPTTVSIAFGTGVTITPAVTTGVTIVQTGSNLAITSTATGVEFKLSGTTTNGSVRIISDKKFLITLNGANITCTDRPAINLQSKKRAFVEVAAGTTNTLTDGAIYATTTEDRKGTFFTEGQIIFGGTGSLTIQGNNKHAIVSDDYIRIHSGNITVSGAASDGIHANTGVIIDGGTLKINANGDGIEAEKGYIVVNGGNITVNAGDKGITASYEDVDPLVLPYVNINGGYINVTTTGEGIESKSVLTINNGTVVASTVDDGLNAGTALYINGGSVYVKSSTNDGIDSNGPISITGGKVVAIGAPASEAGIDCNKQLFKLTGGIVVATGGETSGPSTTASTIHAVILGGSPVSQIIHIEAADGTEALTFTAPTAFNTLLFASAKLKAATTYSTYSGGSVTGGTSFNGLFSSGTYNRGTKGAVTFTTSSLVTQVGGTISK